MKKPISILMCVLLGIICSTARPLTQQPEGERIEMESNSSGEEGIPRSSGTELSVYYYANSETIVVTCQGYGTATVFITSQTLQILDSDVIDPSLSPITCLSTPSTSGEYYIFVTTSSFTAYGTFVVE